MSEFCLSQALPSSPEASDDEMEHRPPEKAGEVLGQSSSMSLKILRGHQGLRQVATLVLVCNQMKSLLPPRSSDLTDMDLLSIVVNNLENEGLIENLEYRSICDARRKSFHRVGSVNQWTLCDSAQKAVVTTDGRVELQALTIKGGHQDRRVMFSMSRYVSPSATAEQTLPVIMSITNTNKKISCCDNGGKPVLLLEECCDDKLNIIHFDEDLARFLFYRRTSGMSLNTFESVKFRGWFISTSPQESHLVEMCQRTDARRTTNFRLNRP